MKVLYTSADVYREISEVMSNPVANDRRVALVAYVGQKAEAFLPDPAGLQIVCSLKAGATDAEVLARFRERGARIYKADRLHMKVYWSRKKGCVITSANASRSAMGSKSQKEVGVRFPAGLVDIDRLWKYASPAIIKKPDLKKLNQEADRIFRVGASAAADPAVDFSAWRRAKLKNWKLGGCSEIVDFAESSILKAKQQYGVKEPYDFMNCSKGQYSPHSWVLSFDAEKGTNVGWLYVNFVVKLDRDYEYYEKAFPFQAVQVHKPTECPRPPFLIDTSFRKAFRKALKEYGVDRLDAVQSLTPPEKFLKAIEKYI